MEIIIKNLSKNYVCRTPSGSKPFGKGTFRGTDSDSFEKGTFRGTDSDSFGKGTSRGRFTGFWEMKALENISVTIPSGIYGLLGPNGAGKTSLMRILATLSEPSDGEIIMNGVPIRETGKIREMTGYLPQEFSFYGNMSVYGALDYLGLLSGIPAKIRRERILTLLEWVNLEENARTKVKALSGGMKRRLGIAQALLHDPKILLTDEPTEGLDPEERVHFRNLLCEFARDRIVILSTHILSDVESCCERIGVLNHGRLIWSGRTEELRTPTLEEGYLRLLGQTEGKGQNI